MVKDCTTEVLPIVTKIVNNSLISGVVPASLKEAIVFPILKKMSLDSEILSNYRPVSNLPFLSKVMERVIFQQLKYHLQSNELCDTFQSAYRTNHSTETVLVKIHDDLLSAIDSGKFAFLLLLDLSAAFDTIDQGPSTDGSRAIDGSPSKK